MGAFKLGKMTFGSLFKKPETTLYPLEKKPQPKGLKGRIVVDAATCILCGMCERNCTTDCITVDKKERFWQINHFGCIQCGYCTTVCPKKCLHMDPNYWPAATAKEIERIGIPAQGEQKAKTGKPAAKAQNGAHGIADTAPGSQMPGTAGGISPKPTATAEAAVADTGAAPSNDAPSGATRGAAAHDAQLKELIALLDAEKAEIVEKALASR